jgi:hypothetical protein
MQQDAQVKADPRLPGDAAPGAFRFSPSGTPALTVCGTIGFGQPGGWR